MRILNDKPTYFLSTRIDLTNLSSSQIWITNVGTNYRTISGKSPLLVLGSASEIIKKVNTKVVSSFEKDSTLYFLKNSEYPRFKLADTSYKRCIKPEKADYFVLGNFCINESPGIGGILEDSKGYYIYPRFISFYGNSSYKNYRYSEGAKFIVNEKLNLGDNITSISYSTICTLNEEQGKDLLNILNGTYDKLITDKMLDETINKQFDALTIEDINSIEDMLDSSDISTREVGLKLLTAYNIQESPMTVRFMLAQRSYLSNLNAWGGVGVQQVLNSINWKGYCDFPRYMYNVDGHGSTKTELDNELMPVLINKAVEKSTKKYLENYNQSLAVYKLKAVLSIEPI